MSYGRFASPQRRLTPITRRPIPQVSIGLHSQGGSFGPGLTDRLDRFKGGRSEHIITKLREAEVALSQGQTVVQVSRSLGITEQTYYRWRNEYGGLKIDQVKRLKELERENTRLKRAVAELTLDKVILKEAAEGNF